MFALPLLQPFVHPRFGAVVVSVDYRRPPETRFPGAFEDGFAALRDVIARIVEFGGDSTRVGLAGDSAGANLAATVAIALVVTWLLSTASVTAWWLTPLAAVAAVGVSLRRASR